MSLRIQVEIDRGAIRALQRRLGRDGFRRKAQAATTEALAYLQRRVVGRTPARTGALRASVGTRLLGMLSGEVRSALEYAGHVEYGTRPHTIVPRSKRALSWPGAAHPVRRVNHPGTRGRYMFRDTAQAEGGAVAGIFARHLAL